jgi:hypothetical protein
MPGHDLGEVQHRTREPAALQGLGVEGALEVLEGQREVEDLDVVRLRSPVARAGHARQQRRRGTDARHCSDLAQHPAARRCRFVQSGHGLGHRLVAVEVDGTQLLMHRTP